MIDPICDFIKKGNCRCWTEREEYAAASFIVSVGLAFIVLLGLIIQPVLWGSSLKRHPCLLLAVAAQQ